MKAELSEKKAIEANELLDLANKELKNSNQQLVQAYAELKSAQAQLVQSEKMASVGGLMAGVSHELGNPLGVVSNGTNNLVRYLVTVRSGFEGFVSDLFKTGNGDVEAFMGLYDFVVEDHDPRPKSEIKAYMEAKSIPYKPRVVDSLSKLGLSDGQLDSLNSLTSKFGLSENTLLSLLINTYEIHSRVETVRAAADRVLPLLEAFKNFAKHEKTTYDLEDINQGINDTLLVLGSAIRAKHVNLETKLEDVPQTMCNAQQLNQVWLNLVKNAVEATSYGANIQVITYKENDYVCVDVVNEGEPIKDPDRVFEPAYSTKKAGTGLGLSISKNIVDSHEGYISGESYDGKTKFTVKIPLKQKK